jgi:methylthioribose-1-phosphate isomerase
MIIANSCGSAVNGNKPQGQFMNCPCIYSEECMSKKIFKPIELAGNCVKMIDQRFLPSDEIWRNYNDAEQIVSAIKDMIIRGAPAIGIAGAYAMYIGALNNQGANKEEFHARLRSISKIIANARPTAVNLSWAVGRMMKKAEEMRKNGNSPDEIINAFKDDALAIHREDIEMNLAMGIHGASLIPQSCNVMTHCNAGALATGGYGTALGVLRAAKEQGKKLKVYACETRPYLQGARLTAWELLKEGFEVILITDSMAGYLMNQGKIDCVITGSDRIARNGDAANKIGTYSHAVLAKTNNVPFYIAAPVTTFDRDMENGSMIPIEERPESEVTFINGKRIAPEGVIVRNPAFDITPAEYITAIITDQGIFKPPYYF